MKKWRIVLDVVLIAGVAVGVLALFCFSWPDSKLVSVTWARLFLELLPYLLCYLPGLLLPYYLCARKWGSMGIWGLKASFFAGLAYPVALLALAHYTGGLFALATYGPRWLSQLTPWLLPTCLLLTASAVIPGVAVSVLAVRLEALRLQHLRSVRFSLLTLLIFTLFVASAGTLWWRWEPWVVMATLDVQSFIRLGPGDYTVFTKDSFVFAAATDSGPRLWNAETGATLTAIKAPRAFSVCLSADGYLVATLCAGPELGVWDTRTGEQLFSVKGQFGMPAHFLTNPDRIIFWSVGQDLAVGDVRTGHLSSIRNCVALGRPGRVATHEDGKLTVFDLQRNTPPVVIGAPTPRSASFSPDREKLVMEDWENRLLVYDTFSGAETCLRGKTTLSQQFIGFSPNGQQVVSADSANIQVFDLGTGRLRWEAQRLAPGRGMVTYTPDSRRLAVLEGEGTVRIWDASSGRIEAEFQSDALDNIHSIWFSRDGERIFIRDNNELSIWSATSGRLLCNTFAEKRVLAVSPDERRVATLRPNGGVDLWTRRRSESALGIFVLPEFWLTLLFGAALVRNIRRDRRLLRKAGEVHVGQTSSSACADEDVRTT